MKLAEREHCTGCAACVNVCEVDCLRMEVSQYGFQYPVLKGQCIGCGACTASCPVLQKPSTSSETKAYAAYSIEQMCRRDSSSGGMFSLLALQVLKTGGVVYGAAYDGSFAVKHIAVEHPEQLDQLRGAKYAQSEIAYCYRNIKKQLEDGRNVLFSGTPCQVAGLSAYLSKQYENLLLVDIVCHSVPSPLAWEKYVEYRAKQDHAGVLPRKINLRSKHTGWSRYTYSNLYEYEDTTLYSAAPHEDIYMRLFIDGYISRESCEHCHYKGYERMSDITLGDFWGIWDICPDMDDNQGTSLLLLHSEKAETWLELLTDSIKIREVTLEDASRQNPAIIKTFALKAGWQQTLTKAVQGDFSYPDRPTSHTTGLKKIVKRMLSYGR